MKCSTSRNRKKRPLTGSLITTEDSRAALCGLTTKSLRNLRVVVINRFWWLGHKRLVGTTGVPARRASGRNQPAFSGRMRFVAIRDFVSGIAVVRWAETAGSNSFFQFFHFQLLDFEFVIHILSLPSGLALWFAEINPHDVAFLINAKVGPRRPMESSRPPWIIGTTFGLVATLVARLSFVAEGSV